MHLTDEQLNEYLDNEIVDRAQTELHLFACDDCAARLTALRALFDEIESLPELALSRDISAPVTRRIDGRAAVPAVPRSLSEFGRRASENGSLGTDHGHECMMMVLGGNVNGGKVHGEWPGMREGQLIGPGDLAVTTDYRDVLSEILTRRLNNEALSDIFPNHDEDGWDHWLIDHRLVNVTNGVSKRYAVFYSTGFLVAALLLSCS